MTKNQRRKVLINIRNLLLLAKSLFSIKKHLLPPTITTKKPLTLKNSYTTKFHRPYSQTIQSKGSITVPKSIRLVFLSRKIKNTKIKRKIKHQALKILTESLNFQTIKKKSRALGKSIRLSGISSFNFQDHV
jgi:hypothetical protein